ncbi:hypothetical protein BH09BAC1_BH09BAC1_14270 [soil metagenome]
MARNKTLLTERNALIRQRYKALDKKNEKGKRIYTYTHLLDMLSREFFLTPAYIQQVLTENTAKI